MKSRSSSSTTLCVCSAVFAILCLGDAARGENLRQHVVEVSATVGTQPAQIRLRWRPDSEAAGYRVYRKAADGGSWGSPVSLTGGAGSAEYLDSDVSVGSSYEYQVEKLRTGANSDSAYGYVLAGIEAPLNDARGTLILVVDRDVAGGLNVELERLRRDLIGDGWKVARKEVGRSDSPASVRDMIRNEYLANSSEVRAVFLFGRVPVAYSGNIYPDGHLNHQGAWPADVFYGEMTSEWSDSTVNTTSAERSVNWNQPGDGKFDQSELPSDAELQVGRVDLFQMTNFSNKEPSRSELDLLRQYLNKNHEWRHGRMPVQRRGMVVDHFGLRGSYAPSGSGWRNFAAMFGHENVFEIGVSNYVGTLRNETYLAAYGAGGGGYYYSAGVAEADDFARYDLKAVFALFLGSYYGDWNNESNFLRSALGSGSILVSIYAGFPHTVLHRMTLGRTVGEGIWLTQNNRTGGLYAPAGQGTHQVHIALMGDPSLRLHPVHPPSGINASTATDGVVLNWTASPDTDLRGYHVYRSTSMDGTFARVTSAPVTGISHLDPAPSGTYTYMVRAVKLESSGGGTYLNASQGIFVTATSGGAAPVAPSAPSGLSAVAASPTQVIVSWTDTSNNETGFKIERRTGTESFSVLRTVEANATTFTDNEVVADTEYAYRVQAYNNGGSSAFTAETQVRTPALPPQTPAAPEGLAAVATSSTSIRLTWTDRSGDEEGFRVEGRATATDYEQIASLGANVTTWDHEGLVPETAYTYRVRAYNSAGNSAYSNEASATTSAGASSPEALTLQVDRIDGGTFRFTISGKNGQNFVLEASADLDQWTQIWQGTVESQPVVATDPDAGQFTRRYYRTRSVE